MTTSAPQWPGQEGTRQQDEIRPASVRLQRTPAPTSSAQTPSQQPTPAQTTTAPLRAAGPGTARRLQPVPDLPGASEGRTRQEQQQRRRAAARRNRFVVVRDPAVHERVCQEAAAWVRSKGWNLLGVEQSPITGPEGNVEFLLGALKEA